MASLAVTPVDFNGTPNTNASTVYQLGRTPDGRNAKLAVQPVLVSGTYAAVVASDGAASAGGARLDPTALGLTVIDGVVVQRLESATHALGQVGFFSDGDPAFKVVALEDGAEAADDDEVAAIAVLLVFGS